VARGISRSEQGKNELAGNDFAYAATLYEREGNIDQANQLRKAATAMGTSTKKRNEGNGIGGQLLTGAAGLIQAIAPLAIKAFVPVGF
jgi:hypothetical protein